MTPRLSRPATILLAAALALPGCDSQIRADVEGRVEEGGRLSAAEKARQRAVQRGEILREDRPFYGTAVKAERGAVSGKPLPAAAEGARGVRLELGGQADAAAVAEAVTAATGIPVNIRTRYVLEDGAVDVPIGTRMAVSHEGPLSAFLDRMAARMDVSWSYDGTVITIDRMARRTWSVPLPLGATEYTDTAEGDGSGASVTTARSLNAWEELRQRLAPLAPPPARITLSPRSGRVEAFGPPSVLAAAGEVIEDTAATARTRIGLEIAVYWVDTEKADDFGLDIGADASAGEFAVSVPGLAELPAAARGEAVKGLVISRGGSRISFEALARDSAVVDYRLASTVSQSGTVAPVAITEERNYIRSVSEEKDDAGANGETKVTRTYEIDELSLGLSITALPRLVAPDRVQLALTVSRRRLVKLEQKGEIQLPRVEARAIRSESFLRAGETLVLSGYEQDRAATNRSGLGILRRIGFGGGTGAIRARSRMVLLVRPSVIPAGDPA